MADMEKSAAQAGSQVTATQTKTTNVHGEEIQVVTTTQYENQVFSSKSDWRIRALSSANLPLRTQHIYVSNDEAKEDAGALTYVMPKNVLKTFIVNSDLRTQVAGLLYGLSPPDAPAVKEIKAIVWAPQRGTTTSVELPADLPEHDFVLKNLEPLGWIHTQAQDLPHIAPVDLVAHSRMMANHAEWTASTICVTAAFTPGSVSLTAYQPTVGGFEWGRKANPTEVIAGNIGGFQPSMADKVQLLLSDRILGATLTPTSRAWNYGLSLSAQWTPSLKYSLTLDRPAAFWDEIHRPQNFLSFAVNEGEGDMADIEDEFA